MERVIMGELLEQVAQELVAPMGLVGQQVLVGHLEPMVLDYHLHIQMEHLPI